MIFISIIVDIKVTGSTQQHIIGRTVASYVVEGKAITLQAWTVHKVSRNLRLPDFKTVRA